MESPVSEETGKNNANSSEDATASSADGSLVAADSTESPAVKPAGAKSAIKPAIKTAPAAKNPGLGTPTGRAPATRLAPVKKGPTAPPEIVEFLSRRRLFLNIGWASIAAFFAGAAAASARFFFPRTIFEPPTQFKAGFPAEFTVGEVNTNFQKSNRVWLVRDPDRIYAIYAKCTHLGCTPVWRGADNKFKCPCHGSGFTREGVNYEGPAPRPLERVKITLAPDGQLLVDTAIRFKGEKNEWDREGSYVHA